jgi:nucleoside-diphosphate-sugar epimerase
MKILITGSSGLIGSALKNALEALEIDVIGHDIKMEYDHPDYGDILHPLPLFTKINQVDGIVHLAAVSRVIDGEKNPALCWKTNVEGTQNITKSALESEKRPWMIYASSREVYGEQSELPVKETAILRPLNIYGHSKLESEQTIVRAQQKGLVGCIVRFSNVFGSVYDHADRVVPAFCRAAAEGSPIRVEGRDNLFDFTYIDDVIQGLISLIRLLSSKNESFLPIHLTRGVGVTLNEIAQIAQKASDYPISIIDGPSRSFDVSRFYGDTTHAQNVLNWKACVPVEEGMHRLINQFRLYFSQNRILSETR